VIASFTVITSFTVETNMQNNGLKMKTELNGNTTEYPLWLKNFVDIYQTLSTDNLALLENIYHQDIIFIDPMHKVEGFNKLADYFAGLYQNLTACEFIIEEVILQDSHAALYWKMNYQHTKLNKGKTITVMGCSHIRGKDDKVYYHRDYLDLGAMLYEQLPVIGRIICWIKRKASK